MDDDDVVNIIIIKIENVSCAVENGVEKKRSNKSGGGAMLKPHESFSFNVVLFCFKHKK